MLVEKLSDEKEWEQFVANSSGGTFYHTLAWKKVLEEAFSLETEYLVIRDASGKLAGVCPFAITSKLRLFRILDSLPESDFGGPLVVDGEASEALKALNDYLPGLCHRKGITYAKIRCPSESLAGYLQVRGMTVDTSTGSMNLDLGEKPPDFIWSRVLKNPQRKYIRRFERDGFQNVEARNIDDLNAFYSLYYNSIKGIGGFPYPYVFFRKLWDDFYSDCFNILLTVGGGKCLGATAFFICKLREAVYQPFIGFDKNVGTHYHIHYYLNWGLIKWCEANGFKVVSFGGTPADPSSANYSLKSKFGASFNQDYVVCLPFDRKRFLAREVALKLGRFIQGRLPPTLRSKVQKAGFGI